MTDENKPDTNKQRAQWFDDFIKQYSQELSIKAKSDGTPREPQKRRCMQCGTQCRVFTVKKNTPNKGRKFISCDCGKFQWLE